MGTLAFWYTVFFIFFTRKSKIYSFLGGGDSQTDIPVWIDQNKIVFSKEYIVPVQPT